MKKDIINQREIIQHNKLLTLLSNRIPMDHNNKNLDKPCLIHNKKPNTYGCMYYKGKVRHIHVLAYELHYPNQEHLNILHKCDNKACSEITHLYSGSQSENTRDIYNKEERFLMEKIDKELLEHFNSLSKEIK